MFHLLLTLKITGRRQAQLAGGPVDWSVGRHCALPAQGARFLCKGRLGHGVAGNATQVASIEHERFQRCKDSGDFAPACEAAIAWQG